MQNVCLWHEADMAIAFINVRLSGVKRTLVGLGEMSAIDPLRKSSVAFCCDAQDPSLRLIW
jgi:hypothetical protein